MRIIISITCLFLFSACHNKNDLKRIDALEKENKELIQKSKNYYQVILKKIEDSIIVGNDYTKGCWWSSFYVINKTSNYSVKLGNGKYTTDIHFAENRDNDFDTIYFSVPTKNRIKKDFGSDYNLLNRAEKNFIFTPKDTGWYYYLCVVPIKNKRTSMVSVYNVSDSFYVYK